MPPGLLVARVVGRIYFANVQNVGQHLRDLVEAEHPKVLILDCSAIPDMEYTALMGLVEWEASGRKQGIRLVLAALNPAALEAVQRTTPRCYTGPIRLVRHRGNCCRSMQCAVGRGIRAMCAPRHRHSITNH